MHGQRNIKKNSNVVVERKFCVVSGLIVLNKGPLDTDI